MSSVLNEIISIITGGLVAMGQAIGQALTETVQAVFVSGAGTTESPYTLSVFGGTIAIFAGIALAVGLTTLVVHWVMSLGARN